MTSKQRRERERQGLRRNILAAALEIAAEEGGWQNVTIRKVADRIEYSPPTIYEHFASKEAILLELMNQGFAQLLEELRAVRTQAIDPAQVLLKMSQSYWVFAFRAPELYQVMHGLGGVAFHSPGGIAGSEQKHHAADQAFNEVVLALKALVDQRGATINDLEAAAEIVWASIHGLIALTMAERIEDRKRGAQLARQTMVYLLTAWGAAP